MLKSIVLLNIFVETDTFSELFDEYKGHNNSLFKIEIAYSITNVCCHFIFCIYLFKNK